MNSEQAYGTPGNCPGLETLPPYLTSLPLSLALLISDASALIGTSGGTEERGSIPNGY